MISVIMPAFNAGRFIAASIESVRAQSFGEWELIVVDDGSTDDTGSIAEDHAASDARIRVIHQANGGIAAARNRGLSEMSAASAYVAFLDNDDVWEKDALETLFTALRQCPNAIGAHGMHRFVDAEGKPILVDGAGVAPQRRRRIDGLRLKTMTDTDRTTFETLAYGNCIGTGSLLIRRAAIERAGMFDPALPVVEDYDMWLRLSLYGDFLFVNRVMYAYRLHAANASRDSGRKNAWLYYVRRKLCSLPGLTSGQRKSISLGFRYYEMYRARVAAQRAMRQLRKGKWRPFLAAAGEVTRHCFQAVFVLPRGSSRQSLENTLD
jgi:glycosyltransferase involved in cell wall biosynthesis